VNTFLKSLERSNILLKKAPVRSKPRVNMVVIGLAAMNNVGWIHQSHYTTQRVKRQSWFDRLTTGGSTRSREQLDALHDWTLAV